MADGTDSQVSDGASGDDSQGTTAHYVNADADRVARIVAALRTAHADRTAAAAAPVPPAVPAPPAPPGPTTATTDTATTPDPVPVAEPSATSDEAPADDAPTTDLPAPRRTATGVRPTVATPPMPTLRWNPGARYRASRLADRPALPAAAAPQPPAPPLPAQAPPVPLPPVPGPPPLAGRLYRGPARRTAVFEREIWYPAARSPRVPRDVGDALIRAVERYRSGSISTSGLVRAIGEAHAA